MELWKYHGIRKQDLIFQIEQEFLDNHVVLRGDLPAAGALEFLIDRMSRTSSNDEFLGSIGQGD
ncbi:MAG: transcription termination factor Rho [Myxococcota bacterium]